MTKTAHTAARVDIYTRVTNRIVEALEAGHRPWLKPWNAEHAAGRITRPLRHNGKQYSGINVICLWMEAESRGFISPYWLTYNQAQELGGHVKKGEHGAPVVYAMEELVAEMGAAFLCADLEITPETREDHAAYIASWLKVLKDDKRAVFSAASYASKAVEYLHGLQPQPAE